MRFKLYLYLKRALINPPDHTVFEIFLSNNFISSEDYFEKVLQEFAASLSVNNNLYGKISFKITNNFC